MRPFFSVSLLGRTSETKMTNELQPYTQSWSSKLALSSCGYYLRASSHPSAFLNNFPSRRLRTKERRRTKAHLIILAAILTIFFTALVLWTLDLANVIMEPKITLLENLDQPIDAKLDNAYSFVFRLAAAQAALYAYMVRVHFVLFEGHLKRSWIAVSAGGCDHNTPRLGDQGLPSSMDLFYSMRLPAWFIR